MTRETPEACSDRRKPTEEKEETQETKEMEYVPKMSPRYPQNVPKMSLKES